MMEKKQRLQGRLGPEIIEFRQQCKTLQLATLSNDIPHTSYTPFAHNDQGYYILVSDIAQHGQNLKAAKAVSIMMIEDESLAKSIYARRRLSFDTQAKLVNKTSSEGLAAIAALRDRFGEIIDNLSQLGDFCLYQLIPEKGRYVKGFGQAFDITGNDEVDFVHLTSGHISTKKAS